MKYGRLQKVLQSISHEQKEDTSHEDLKGYIYFLKSLIISLGS